MKKLDKALDAIVEKIRESDRPNKMTKIRSEVVKGFNNHELNEAFRVSPEIVCDYISALKRVLDMSEETNKKAIAKIRELSNTRKEISLDGLEEIIDKKMVYGTKAIAKAIKAHLESEG